MFLHFKRGMTEVYIEPVQTISDMGRETKSVTLSDTVHRVTVMRNRVMEPDFISEVVIREKWVDKFADDLMYKVNELLAAGDKV